jgi:hypothetical protein
MALKREELPHVLTFPSEKKARHFRLRWHGYRRAVAKLLESASWGDEQSLKQEEFDRSARYAARLRVDPFTNEAQLVFEPRMSDEELWNVAKTFIGKVKPAATTPAIDVPAPLSNIDMGNAIMQNTLAKLGFTPGTTGNAPVSPEPAPGPVADGEKSS